MKNAIFIGLLLTSATTFAADQPLVPDAAVDVAIAAGALGTATAKGLASVENKKNALLDETYRAAHREENALNESQILERSRLQDESKEKMEAEMREAKTEWLTKSPAATKEYRRLEANLALAIEHDQPVFEGLKNWEVDEARAELAKARKPTPAELAAQEEIDMAYGEKKVEIMRRYNLSPEKARLKKQLALLDEEIYAKEKTTKLHLKALEGGVGLEKLLKRAALGAGIVTGLAAAERVRRAAAVVMSRDFKEKGICYSCVVSRAEIAHESELSSEGAQ